MSLVRGAAVVLVLVLAGCGGGDTSEMGAMDGLIDGVPVDQVEDTTTTTPSETTAPPGTTAPTETAGADAPAPPPEVDDFEVWRAEVGGVCTRFEALVAEQAETLVPPGTLEQAPAYFDAFTPLRTRYMRAIRAVPTPTNQQDEVERLHAATEDLASAAETAQAAANFQDPSSYGDAVGALNDAVEQARALLADLGLPECLPA